MARFMLVIVIAAFPVARAAAIDSTLSIDTRIEKVTVFAHQARITRTGTVELPAGEFGLFIEDLPGSIRERSFKASATSEGKLTLLGLNHRQVNHSQAVSAKRRDRETQVATLESESLQAVKDRLEGFAEQKELLKAIVVSAGNTMGKEVSESLLGVEQWHQAYLFLGTRLIQTNDSIRHARQELATLESQLSKLKADLHTLSRQQSHTTKTVEIDVRNEKEGEVTVTLEYVIPGARWTSLYDARLNGDSDSLSLTRYAEVTQQTGEDWDNVELELSTVTLSYASGPGEVKSWRLARKDSRLDKVITVMAKRDILDRFETSSPEIIRPEPIGKGPIGDPLGGIAQSGSAVSLVAGSVVIGDYATVFRIRRRETIPSGPRAVRTTIGVYKLGTRTTLICRPRNRQAVYRMITAKNMQETPLMSGPVALFADANYLGEAKLRTPVAPGQEFILPYGIYNSVEVTRHILGYKRSIKGKKTIIRQLIRITLTNHSSRSRNIQLEEPLPVSQDNKVKVKVGKVRPEPEINRFATRAMWKLTLQPDEELTIDIPVRIEFPTGTIVTGL